MNPGLVRGLAVFSILVALGIVTSIFMLRKAQTSASKGLFFRGIILVWLVINLLLLLLVILIR